MTTMTREISNSDDVIDSRDVIDRIAELEAAQDAFNDGDSDDFTEEDQTELVALRALRDAAEPYCEDWCYGATLIRDSYFTEYAEQLAEDLGVSPAGRETLWPLNHIDWEAAAEELQTDYTTVDFDGEEYWHR